MPSLKELGEKSARIAQQMCQLRESYNERKAKRDKGEDALEWADGQLAEWERLNKEYDDLQPLMEAERRADEINTRAAEVERRARGLADQNTPGLDRQRPTEVDQRLQGAPAERRDFGLALQAWALNREPSFTLRQEHLEACHRVGIRPELEQIQLRLSDTGEYRMAQVAAQSRESRALLAGTGASGGFTVPTGFVPRLESALLAIGGVEPHAEVLLTDSGENLPWPTANDTSNEGEIVGENVATLNNEDPVFAVVTLGAFVFSSKVVSVSNLLIEDNAVALESRLGGMLGDRIGRRGNRMFTTGTGTAQPRGFITAAVSAFSVPAPVGDDVIRLAYSVDPAYRMNARYMAHNNIMQTIRLFKDSSGRYLWQEGLRNGQPESLNGYPVEFNAHMDSAIAASNKTLAFGDFSKYKIRRVRTFTVKRLIERSADKNATDFLLFVRQDGNLLDAGTRPIKFWTN